MRFEDFVYPPYGGPLVEAYGSRYESAFVVLHPFVQVPEALSWKVRRAYPEDGQIAAAGTKCRWSQVSAQIGLASCARMNQVLLTSIWSHPG